MSGIFTFIRILLLLVHVLVLSQGRSRLVALDPKNRLSPPGHLETLSHTRVAAIPREKGAFDLANSWCSAYRRSDPKRLAALETREMEIVDRSGYWEHLIGFKAREVFWAGGFEMIRQEDFRPECSVKYVRLIGLSAAIAQVRVSYQEGITLKDGDRLPPFCEIHTLFLVRIKGTWLVSGIAQQDSQFAVEGSTCPSD